MLQCALPQTDLPPHHQPAFFRLLLSVDGTQRYLLLSRRAPM